MTQSRFAALRCMICGIMGTLAAKDAKVRMVSEQCTREAAPLQGTTELCRATGLGLQIPGAGIIHDLPNPRHSAQFFHIVEDPRIAPSGSREAPTTTRLSNRLAKVDGGIEALVIKHFSGVLASAARVLQRTCAWACVVFEKAGVQCS